MKIRKSNKIQKEKLLKVQINIEIQISFNPNYTYDGKRTLIVINIFPPKCQQHPYLHCCCCTCNFSNLGIDKEKKNKHFPGSSEFAGFAVERWLPLISIIWRRYPQSRLSLCRNISSHSSMRGLSVCVWNKRSVPYPVRYIRDLSSVSSHAAGRTKRKNSRPVLDVQAFTDRVSRFYRSNTCLQSQYDTVWWDVSVNAYVSWREP